MLEEKLTALLAEKFKEPDFADCYLVEINLPANQKVEIFVDSDSGMTFGKCQKISRYLEHHIEENEWLGERYTIDVSSPGVGRPLKFTRQYVKNVGRKLEVKLTDGSKHTGTLVSADEDGIRLESKVRVKEGNKKRNKIIETAVPYVDIEKAVVKITF